MSGVKYDILHLHNAFGSNILDPFVRYRAFILSVEALAASSVYIGMHYREKFERAYYTNLHLYKTRMWPRPNVMAALPNTGGALFQRRKLWLTPITRVPCSNATKTRNPLKLAGVPQTNEPISAASKPKFTILQEHMEQILMLNKLFSDCRYVP